MGAETTIKGETGVTVWAYRNKACLSQHSTEGCTGAQQLAAQNTIYSHSGVVDSKGTELVLDWRPV